MSPWKRPSSFYTVLFPFQDRIRNAKRRKSVVEDGRANLKQRFAERRRRSENVSHTVRAFRTQHSVCDSGRYSAASHRFARIVNDTASDLLNYIKFFQLKHLHMYPFALLQLVLWCGFISLDRTGIENCCSCFRHRPDVRRWNDNRRFRGTNASTSNNQQSGRASAQAQNATPQGGSTGLHIRARIRKNQLEPDRLLHPIRAQNAGVHGGAHAASPEVTSQHGGDSEQPEQDWVSKTEEQRGQHWAARRGGGGQRQEGKSWFTCDVKVLTSCSIAAGHGDRQNG